MLLRESRQFPAYNYRTYALQRVKDAFRANRSVGDPQVVAKLVEEGHQTLALIKRQVSIGKLYVTQRNIVDDVRPD